MEQPDHAATLHYWEGLTPAQRFHHLMALEKVSAFTARASCRVGNLGDVCRVIGKKAAAQLRAALAGEIGRARLC